MNYKEFFEARLNNLPFASVGPVKLFEQQINEYLEAGNRYIVTYKKVYEIVTANYKPGFVPFRGHLVYSSPEALTRRGRYYPMSAKAVNDLLGFELLAH